MTRISTAQLNSVLVGSALSVQAQYAQAETQQASGLVASDFGTLGGASTSEMLNLEHEIEQSQTWASAATTVGNTTQTMYSAIGNMISTVTQLQTKISSAMSTSDNSNLAAAVKSLQQTLVSEINTKGARGYVFAGSNTGSAPVSTASLAAYSQNGGLKTSYYTGDTQVLSVQISSQQTVSYGVTADSTGFEEAMRAMQITADAASGTLSTSTLTASDPVGGTTSLTTADTFTINGVTVPISANNESLQAVADDINTAAAAASSSVSAKVVYNGTTYVLQVSSGSTAALSFTGTAASTLGLSDNTYSASLQSVLSSALTVATQAVKDLSVQQESVATSASALTSATTLQSTYITFLQNSLSGVKDVDTAQAAANVSKYQTQLQASYLAVAQITKVNLAQYL